MNFLYRRIGEVKESIIALEVGQKVLEEFEKQKIEFAKKEKKHNQKQFKLLERLRK